MYNVFGDDGFHDYFSDAQAYAEEGDMDRAKSALGDALGVAMELYKGEEAYRKDRGETGYEFEPRFGLKENDDVLDEIINEREETFLQRAKRNIFGGTKPLDLNDENTFPAHYRKASAKDLAFYIRDVLYKEKDNITPGQRENLERLHDLVRNVGGDLNKSFTKDPRLETPIFKSLASYGSPQGS